MSNKTHEKVVFPLFDEELAELSSREWAGELTLVSSRPTRGGVYFKYTDEGWVYNVLVDYQGDWVWGFKQEA